MRRFLRRTKECARREIIIITENYNLINEALRFCRKSKTIKLQKVKCSTSFPLFLLVLSHIFINLIFRKIVENRSRDRSVKCPRRSRANSSVQSIVLPRHLRVKHLTNPKRTILAGIIFWRESPTLVSFPRDISRNEMPAGSSHLF